jgi:hypothetical protein
VQQAVAEVGRAVSCSAPPPRWTRPKNGRITKSIEVDIEDTLKTINLVNPNCNAEEVLKAVFNDGEEVKFKIHTKDKSHYARLMLDKRESLVKKYNKT